ncbi:sporulation inhibitor of replication protein SirA [Halobacillus mangrovi]|uniref:sporulation inhibitor of replication protein SirA n=1 Tax=Halobacillus mangrovi TaxID=402384 RepID=UPI003D97F78A
MQFFIFSIKDEIAQHYYNKVELMKRFFLEFVRNSKSVTYIKQFSYISELFPFKEWIEDCIQEGNTSRKSISFSFPFFDNDIFCGIMDNKNYCCLFQCDSLWQANKDVFQPLRTSSQSFFIVEKNGEHYGWISPLASQCLLT